MTTGVRARCASDSSFFWGHTCERGRIIRINSFNRAERNQHYIGQEAIALLRRGNFALSRQITVIGIIHHEPPTAWSNMPSSRLSVWPYSG